jgi:acyl dehydratase
MNAAVALQFSKPPPGWQAYSKILVGRKPALLKDGRSVPRIEAQLSKATVSRSHLAEYAQICGATDDGSLPIAYPHMLAFPLHLAILSSAAFPLRALGLVHIHNRIALRATIDAAAPATISAWLEGHRETERGQEFDLQSEYAIDRKIVWDETCTFLARRRGRAPSEKRPSALDQAAPDAAPPGAAVKSSSFEAPAGLGRRYGWISGDLNPIHVADLTARAFGFKQAIAHGMWSMARCAAEFSAQELAAPCDLSVSFKLPIFMPAWVMMQRWSIAGGSGFALRDAQGEKPHLTGTLRSLR